MGETKFLTISLIVIGTIVGILITRLVLKKDPEEAKLEAWNSEDQE